MDPSYTNPFANGGTTGQVPVPMPNNTPVTGDIVLQPEKKSKKKIIIVVIGIIFVVIIGACCIINAIISNKQYGAQSISKEDKDLISDFASEILFGDGRQVDLDTLKYSSSREYKIQRAVLAGDNEYMSNVITAFDSLKEKIINEETPEYMTKFLKEYGGNLEFLQKYVAESERTLNTVAIEYMNNDKNGALAIIDEHYKSLLNSEATTLKDYFALKVEVEKEFVEVMEILNSSGCIIDNTIENCNLEDVSVKDRTARAKILTEDMESIEKSSIKYAENGCWTIYDLMTNSVGGKDEK